MMMFLMLLDSPEEKSEFAAIYENYHMDVYRMAYDVLKDHHLAQDAGQMVFLKVAKRFDRVRDVDLLKRRSYILAIARNEALNLIDKEKDVLHLDEVLSESLPDTERLLEEQIIDFENSREMCEALTKLNRSYSEILYLRFYLELDINEIAEIIDLKKSLTYVRLHRAIKALRTIIGKEDAGYEPGYEQQS